MTLCYSARSAPLKCEQVFKIGEHLFDSVPVYAMSVRFIQPQACWPQTHAVRLLACHAQISDAGTGSRSNGVQTGLGTT